MPLFVDDELINKEHRYYNWVVKELTEIRGKMFIHIIPNRNIKRSFTFGIDGRTIPDVFPSTMEPTTCNKINDDGIGETWRWSSTHPSKKKTKEGSPYLEYPENAVKIFEGELILDTRKDAELAFFLIKIKENVIKGRFEVEDPEKEASELADQYSKDSVLKYLIFGKINNPFYSNEMRVRDISASWGINNSDSMSISILRNKLYEKVKESDEKYSVTNRGVQEFVDEVNGTDPYSEYRSNIQKAVDSGVIVWDDKDNHFYWADKYSKQKTQPFLGIASPEKHMRDKLLFEYFKVNEESYSYIRGIGVTDVVIGSNAGSTKLATSKYSHLKWPSEFRNYASERGVEDVNKKTRVVIEQELEELDKRVLA
jgi:hypothetical protein